MCGRTSETADEVELQAYVDRLRARYPRDFPPRRKRRNIAPSQPQLVIAEIEGEREARMMRWGLVPFWAKDILIGNKMINALAETVATKPSYREALKRRRRTVPDSCSLGAMGPKQLETCTIITTAAAGVMRPLHDRMPVMIHEDLADVWLDGRTSAGDVQELIAGAGIELESYPVSEYVNHPANQGPMCGELDESAG